ncbi:MAG: hypothetical protein U1F65_01155 [Verrucomicrobiota bacterium]
MREIFAQAGFVAGKKRRGPGFWGHIGRLPPLAPALLKLSLEKFDSSAEFLRVCGCSPKTKQTETL